MEVVQEFDKLINELAFERVGKGRAKLEAPALGVGSAFGQQPAWSQLQEYVERGLITPTSVLMSSVSLPKQPAAGSTFFSASASTGGDYPLPAKRENGFVVQSAYFDACPNCRSTDVSSNRVRGFSRCEKCFYTVDPTNRPSRKEIEVTKAAQAGQYVGTKALPHAMQSAMTHNAKILAGGGAQTQMMYEMFHACQTNDIKKINELLNLGIDVNCSDFDTGATPLHWACAKSQQHAIRLLVERGANVNAQNKRGMTPLHSLIINRIEPLAFWLIRKGADIMLTDVEGQAPVDLALPWTQAEMKQIFAEVRAGRNEIVDPVCRVIPAEKRPETLPTKAEPTSVVEREVMKIFLKNDAYKSLIVTSETTGKDICEQMAEKLNLGRDFAKYFDVTERVKRGDQYMERRLDGRANLFELKSKWPLIFGDSGNETSLHCRFIINVKRGSATHVQEKFREAVYGGVNHSV